MTQSAQGLRIIRRSPRCGNSSQLLYPLFYLTAESKCYDALSGLIFRFQKRHLHMSKRHPHWLLSLGNEPSDWDLLPLQALQASDELKESLELEHKEVSQFVSAFHASDVRILTLPRAILSPYTSVDKLLVACFLIRIREYTPLMQRCPSVADPDSAASCARHDRGLPLHAGCLWHRGDHCC